MKIAIPEIPFWLITLLQILLFIFFILPKSIELNNIISPIVVVVVVFQLAIFFLAFSHLIQKGKTHHKKYFYILWEIQIFIFIFLSVILNPLQTFSVQEISTKALIFFSLMLIAIESIFLVYAIFREKVITKILFTLATSTTIIVFLIVFFVLMEGLPAFQENDPIDFITSSEWDPYYESEVTESLILTTTITDESYSIETSNQTIYLPINQTETVKITVTNLKQTKENYSININSDIKTNIFQDFLEINPNSKASTNLSITTQSIGINNVKISVIENSTNKIKTKNIICVTDTSDVTIKSEKQIYKLRRDDSQLQIPVKITNVAKTNETYNLSLTNPSYFIPSFNQINWINSEKKNNITESFLHLSLSPFETKTLILNPRFVYKTEGDHSLEIKITSLNNPKIRANNTIIISYTKNQLLTTEKDYKKTSLQENASFIINFDTSRDRTLNFKIEAITGNAKYNFIYENQSRQEINEQIVIQPNQQNSSKAKIRITPIDNNEKNIQTKVTLNIPGETPQLGAFPFIIGTFITTIIAVLIATPLGIGTAILLAEFTPNRIRKLLRPIYELLAGIPSVVYGLWGFITLGPLIKEYIYPVISSSIGQFIPFFSSESTTGNGFFTASIVLSIMIVPIIITLSEDAIRSVSKSLKEGSLALGTTRWQTMRHVILPKAKSGIVSSIILGTGRAIGETMAVLMILGASVRVPSSIFDSGMTMTGVIAAFFECTFNHPLSRHALFGIGSILFFMVFFLNVVIVEIQRRTDNEKDNNNKNYLITKLKKLFKRANTLNNQNKKRKISKKFQIINETSKKKFQIIDVIKKDNLNSYSKTSKNVAIVTSKNSKNKERSNYYKKINLTYNPIKKAWRQQKIMKTLFLSFSIIISIFLIYILGFVIFNGGLSLSPELFLSREISGGKEGGFLNAILGSLYLIAIAIFIAGPLSIGAAIYVQEYAKKQSIITRIILFTSDTLASTPSIIFGAFGFMLFVLYLEFGFSLLAGGITLAFMIIPLMLRSSIEAIKSIPHELHEGALALGATKWQSIRTVILPPATPGIISGVIIAMGRAIGESAAVLLTAGYAIHLPSSLLAGAASMPIMIYSYYDEALRTPILADKVYSAALILIIIVLLLNGIARIFSYRASKMMKY